MDARQRILGAFLAVCPILVPLSAPVVALHGCAGGEAVAPAKIERSAAARRAFQRLMPCPATGRTRGACPGWVVDHVVPLACGGADAPANMQWQTREAARAKDRWERRDCARPGAPAAPVDQ